MKYRISKSVTKYLLTAILFLCINNLHAKSYYIAPAPAGSDINTGAIGSPWATLVKADSMVAPGDTVFVRSGTYMPVKQIMLSKTGQSGKFITYKAYPGELPVFDFTNCPIPAPSGVPPYPHDLGVITILNTKYVRVEGIKVIHSKCAGIQPRGSKHAEVIKCSTYDTYSSGISAWDSDTVLIDGNTIELACNTGPHECISISRSQHFTVSNNEIKNTTAVSSTNGGEGIDCKEACHYGKLINNYIHDLNRQGLYVDSWDQQLFDIEEYGNIVTRCMYGFCVSTEQPNGTVDNIRFHHNVIYDCDRTGIDITNWGPDDTRSNIHIYNNTVYNNGWRRVAAGGSPHGGLLIECTNIPNMVIENNIFAHNCSFCYATKDTLNKTIKVDYNLLADYNNSNKNLLRKNDGTFFTFGFGSTYALHGTHEVVGKAMFVDSAKADFHLQQTSQAIDQGNPAASFNDPDSTRNDIGAFYFYHASPIPVLDIMNLNYILVQTYPNPASENFEILINGFDNMSALVFKIYNVSGKIVHEQKITGNNILQMTGKNFEKGVYIIEVNDGLHSGIGKFIIQ
jgi:hypothetical protein